MRRRIIWLVSIVGIACAAWAFRSPAEKYFEIAKSLDIFATLFKEVNAYYVDEVAPEKLIRTGIDGMLETLDPYTDYIPEDEIESFRISTTGQYGGIGALIGVVNKKIVITHPYKNFPAHKGGLKVGDEIVEVDGKPIQDKSTSEISTLLKGQPKTEVVLKIRRYGKKDDLTVTLKREKININNLGYTGMINAETGYIQLTDFTPGASREVADAVTQLKEQGAKKIILDLRDNPGGLLHEAVNIVGLFIPRGLEVVSTKGKAAEWNKTFSTLNAPLDITIPLAVLVNDGSASASEIVAGALQDYDRAILIGNRTFGKGLVQTTRPLVYNSQLKVTTAKYYIPSGRCIQALDYSHRKEDGTVSRVADSLKAEFKTKKGRKVFDGGGLDPDIVMEEEYAGAITNAVANSGLLFDYATKYCAEHPDLPDFKTFTLADSEYDKFVKYLKEQKFSYTTPLERSVKQLTEVSKKEKYYTEMDDQLAALKSKIEASKANDLIRFKSEILQLLTEQIAFHYSQTDGASVVSLQYDKDVKEANRLLIDTASYSKILSPL